MLILKVGLIENRPQVAEFQQLGRFFSLDRDDLKKKIIVPPFIYVKAGEKIGSKISKIEIPL